jgi:HEAT repeat protein/beta-lactamase regulating signal transducer with metallopeptidase domain
MIGFTEFLLNFLANSTWQIAAIFLLATVGTYFLKNCSANYRHLVWITALFFCLLAPVISAIQVVPTFAMNPRSDSTSPPQNTTTDDEVAVDHTRRRSSQVVINTEPQNMQLIAVAYLLFLGLCLFRFVRLWLNKERLRRSLTFDALTAPIESSLTRCMSVFAVDNVRLGRSQTARVPYTLGIRRPLIVLPDSFCGDVDQETLLSVIAHEMAHVRRKDFLTKLACELISLPLSFHPVTFLIKRQIERERELACDELVTQQMLQPETYARSLLRAADLSIMPARRSVMLSVFDGRMLEERIRLLLHKQFSLSKWSGRMITAAVLGVLCLSSVFGSAFGFSFGPQKGAKSTSLIPPVESPTAPAPDSSSAQDAPDSAARGRSSSVQQGPQELAQTACDAGRSRNTEAIPSLLAMLGDDRPIEPIACYTTGNWSPALDTFKRPSPGEQAALALASMGRAAFPALMNQLDDSNATTRRNAAWAIGELTNMPPDERAPAVPQLITLLRDSDAWVRMAAARAIGEVRDRRASETLITTLSDADWRVRRLAAWALNEMKEPLAVAALCRLLLGDSRAEVRRAAAEALGEIASAEALPALQQALNDPESAVRAKVSWAIAEIEDN